MVGAPPVARQSARTLASRTTVAQRAKSRRVVCASDAALLSSSASAGTTGTRKYADAPAQMVPETKAISEIGAAAADVLARAVLAGVLAAGPVAGIATYRTTLPGTFA